MNLSSTSPILIWIISVSVCKAFHTPPNTIHARKPPFTHTSNPLFQTNQETPSPSSSPPSLISQTDASPVSKDEFDQMHNDVLVQLTNYCEIDRTRKNSRKKKLLYKWDDDPWREQGRLLSPDSTTQTNPLSLKTPQDQILIPTTIFIGNDDSNGDTISNWINHGKRNPHQCYVANANPTPIDSLKQSNGGMLPDSNVIAISPTEALTIGPVGGRRGPFSSIEFTIYSFHIHLETTTLPQIIQMFSAALLPEFHAKKYLLKHQTMAVGYRLIGSNEIDTLYDVMQMELEIGRALSMLAKTRGMRTRHVLEDPERYGISSNTFKMRPGGNELQSWFILEADD